MNRNRLWIVLPVGVSSPGAGALEGNLRHRPRITHAMCFAGRGGRQYRAFTHAVCVLIPNHTLGKEPTRRQPRCFTHQDRVALPAAPLACGNRRTSILFATPTAFDAPQSGVSRPMCSCMLERVTWRGVRKRVEGWVRWSDPVCAMSRKPSPMSLPRVSETVANAPAAG